MRYHAGHVWKILGGLGWSPRRPVGRARERNEQAIRSWKKKTWPAIKKSPAGRAPDRLPRRKRMEPAPALLPHLGTTGADASTELHLQWEDAVGGGGADLGKLLFPALPGQHPLAPSSRVLSRADEAHRLSAADCVGSAAGPPQPAGARVHRSAGRPPRHGVRAAVLPELDPVEYLWSYWKQHELPNVCPQDYWEDQHARRALRRMRRRPRLITAFWTQAKLWPE